MPHDTSLQPTQDDSLWARQRRRPDEGVVNDPSSAPRQRRRASSYEVSPLEHPGKYLMPDAEADDDDFEPLPVKLPPQPAPSAAPAWLERQREEQRRLVERIARQKRQQQQQLQQRHTQPSQTPINRPPLPSLEQQAPRRERPFEEQKRPAMSSHGGGVQYRTEPPVHAPKPPPRQEPPTRTIPFSTARQRQKTPPQFTPPPRPPQPEDPPPPATTTQRPRQQQDWVQWHREQQRRHQQENKTQWHMAQQQQRRKHQQEQEEQIQWHVEPQRRQHQQQQQQQQHQQNMLVERQKEQQRQQEHQQNMLMERQREQQRQQQQQQQIILVERQKELQRQQQQPIPTGNRTNPNLPKPPPTTTKKQSDTDEWIIPPRRPINLQIDCVINQGWKFRDSPGNLYFRKCIQAFLARYPRDLSEKVVARRIFARLYQRRGHFFVICLDPRNGQVSFQPVTQHRAVSDWVETMFDWVLYRGADVCGARRRKDPPSSSNNAVGAKNTTLGGPTAHAGAVHVNTNAPAQQTYPSIDQTTTDTMRAKTVTTHTSNEPDATTVHPRKDDGSAATTTGIKPPPMRTTAKDPVPPVETQTLSDKRHRGTSADDAIEIDDSSSSDDDEQKNNTTGKRMASNGDDEEMPVPPPPPSKRRRYHGTTAEENGGTNAVESVHTTNPEDDPRKAPVQTDGSPAIVFEVDFASTGPSEVVYEIRVGQPKTIVNVDDKEKDTGAAFC